MSSKYGTIENNTSENEEHNKSGIKISSILKRRRWTCGQNTVFGFGHVFNDLCAAMWFSYMMLFFQAVMEMRAAAAGAMLLLGQIVDAVATPVVGMLADRYSSKKTWHLSGCILVTLSFPMLFLRCPGCEVGLQDTYLGWWMPLYYAVLIILFQVGWAVVQISHLAMIPDISDSQQVRSELTSIRYMASVTSSITVYLITWVILKSTNYSTFIGPADDFKFRDVSLTISAIGITSWIIFHAVFKLRSQKKLKIQNGNINENGSKLHLIPESDTETPAMLTMVEFLKSPLLYQSSFLYVFSRLYWALSLVYVPLYLEERLSINPSNGSELVASVPLVLYISSFISSFFIKIAFKSKFTNGGNQIAYLVGSCISLSGCVWIALAIEPTSNIAQIYLVAALIGAGSSITLVASLCVTADFIGPNSNKSAAIYSFVTFADKLVTGIAVVAIENYKCTNISECPQYYRGVLTYACGGSALLGIISLAITKATSFKRQTTSC